MDLTKKLLDDKIERAKQVAAPIDAIPIIKLMLRCKDKLSKEANKELIDDLMKKTKEAGVILLDRALSDGTISEKELKWYQNKGLKETDFASLLQGYYNRKDGEIPEKDKVVIITVSDSPMLAIRSKLEKKFDVKILNIYKAVDYVKYNVRQRLQKRKRKQVINNGKRKN